MTGQELLIAPVDWQPQRVIVTGYYDGPTEGIIDFGDAVRVFCFKAVAFDFDRQMRVSKLARVPSGEQLEWIVESLSSSLGPPKWPFWVPIWDFSDESERLRVEAELDAFCAAGETVMAVLTDEALEKCFAVRKIDRHSELVVSDWFSLFA